MKSHVVVACLLAILISAQVARAQATAPAQAPAAFGDRGWTSYVQFEGSSNSLGQIMDLDSSLGYNFTEHLGVDVGVPIYFVQGSSSQGYSSFNGLGNAYADLRLNFLNPAINYATMLTGYAPTGDQSRGLSTGRATFDWNNRIDHSYGALTPFLDAGFGNTVTSTRLFMRPFTSLGYNAHIEGGAEYSFLRILGVGASGYDILPTGQQKVYSRLFPANTPARGPGANNRFFAQAPEVTGGADLVKDDGFSTWLDATPNRYMDLEVGFTRSVHYALNTVSFGVGVNVGRILRQSKSGK